MGQDGILQWIGIRSPVAEIARFSTCGNPGIGELKSQRIAGIPGMTLVASAWVSVFAPAAQLGPVLPHMTQHFIGVPHVDVMIALVATLPAFFMVALPSIPFGVVG